MACRFGAEESHTHASKMCISGLFAVPLVSLRSHRWTAFCGVIVMSAGVALSAFAKTPADMLISAGIVVGEGKT